jgi:hypothetical protein
MPTPPEHTISRSRPFNCSVSRRLDSAVAAADEIATAIRCLKAAHRLQPDCLPHLGVALAASVFAGVEAVERQRVIEAKADL